ncbi:uncharacterized protein LOC109851882 [Pseudomyrmex gracilis]|uniref:uncharacterized protein LOC109851882 n=1 Tax=Pseudomyrmex gracilis TaxID=219809 RepID=UPI0009951A92|nr:uncharacterized protein LOC109851882 [Pseudomyrmex gracilis]XP_020278002.1 uncharacterized protein LOC109851882 [Pseudomyrmex gracilis]
MDIDNQDNDPQFLEILKTCLTKEIAAVTEKLKNNQMKIDRFKATMRNAIDTRKQLKQKVVQMEDILSKLRETSIEVYISVNEITDALETTKINADDQYKLMELKSQEYQNIMNQYKETWHSYHAMYEEFPLAKARKEVKIKLEKLKIEYMIAVYKKAEMTNIIKQRRHIDWVRTRCKIIEFAAMMAETSKLEEKLLKLKVNVNYRKKKLQSIQTELQGLRKKTEEQKKLRQQKMMEMVPPKINIPQREIYARNKLHTRRQHHWKRIQDTFDDTASVNTLAFEELCINENASMSPEMIDVETGLTIIKNDTPKQDKAHTTKSFNSKITAEKADKRADSVPPPNAETSGTEKVVQVITVTDSDEEIKKILQEKEQKSQESVKVQPSSRTKENSLKHGIVADTQGEIETKRMRLQTEDSRESGNKITSLQPSVIEEVDMKSPVPSGPRISKIESVQYNVMITKPMPKPNHQETGIAASSVIPVMLSPIYEYCESNTSFDFMSKDARSVYEESLCNYKISSIGNISPECVDNVSITSTRNFALHQNVQDEGKDPSNERTASPFHFENFVKKKKQGFTLF